MRMRDYKVFLPGNDLHLKVTVDRVDGFELVDDGGDAHVAGFGEDHGADVVFVGKAWGTEVHVADVAYCCEAAGDFVYFGW